MKIIFKIEDFIYLQDFATIKLKLIFKIKLFSRWYNCTICETGNLLHIVKDFTNGRGCASDVQGMKYYVSSVKHVRQRKGMPLQHAFSMDLLINPYKLHHTPVRIANVDILRPVLICDEAVRLTNSSVQIPEGELAHVSQIETEIDIQIRTIRPDRVECDIQRKHDL